MEISEDKLNNKLRERISNSNSIIQTCCYSRHVYEKIIWQITDKCPLNCQYCFTPGSKPSDISMDSALYLLRYLREKYPWKHRILFAGREPLLYDGIEKLILEATANRFICSLSTSGELLTKYFAEKLNDSGLQKINFTLNSSDPDIHEKSRVGSQHSKVVKAISLALDFEFDVKVNIVVDENTYPSLDDTLKFLIGLGVHKITLGMLHPFGKQSVPKARYNQMCSWIYKILNKYQTLNVELLFIQPPTGIECFHLPNCPARKGLIAILPNGRITNCNIFTNPFDQHFIGEHIMEEYKYE
ncbi:MAG: radical SAM protein [Candidatus Zixiibacteriota bacterium]